MSSYAQYRYRTSPKKKTLRQRSSSNRTRHRTWKIYGIWHVRFDKQQIEYVKSLYFCHVRCLVRLLLERRVTGLFEWTKQNISLPPSSCLRPPPDAPKNHRNDKIDRRNVTHCNATFCGSPKVECIMRCSYSGFGDPSPGLRFWQMVFRLCMYWWIVYVLHGQYLGEINLGEYFSLLEHCPWFKMQIFLRELEAFAKRGKLTVSFLRRFFFHLAVKTGL